MRYPGAMATIQVKHVPSETHIVLRRRAAAAGKSLQEYLLNRLVEDASRPTLDEVFERVSHRSGGDAALNVTTEIVRGERDGR